MAAVTAEEVDIAEADLVSKLGKDPSIDVLATAARQVVGVTPERLREARQELGLTKAAVAGLLGVSEGWVRHIEGGRRGVPAKRLVEVLKVYGVRP